MNTNIFYTIFAKRFSIFFLPKTLNLKLVSAFIKYKYKSDKNEKSKSRID